MFTYAKHTVLVSSEGPSHISSLEIQLAFDSRHQQQERFENS